MKNTKYLYTSNTHNTAMVSQRLDITLTPPLVEKIDSLVKEGIYNSRSEFLREATRKLYIEIMRELTARSVPADYDSVKSVREGKKKRAKNPALALS